MRDRAVPLCAPASFVVLALLTGCDGDGGGGDGNSTADSGTVALLVGDGPTDSLSAFEMTLVGVTLVRSDGTETDNLLEAARTLDLLHFRTTSALVDVVAAAPGTYDGARLTFDAASVVARGLDGALVPVQVIASAALGLFTLPVALEADDHVNLHLELELDDALTPSVPGPGWDFTPLLIASRSSGEAEPVDELHGNVVAIDASQNQLLVALAERDDSSLRGEVGISVDDVTTDMLRDDGSRFGSAAEFFAAVVVGDRIEANGELGDDGRMHATLLQIEHDDSFSVARIDGTIVAISLFSTLTLRMRSIEFGHEVVDPVLSALGNPPEIEVSYIATQEFEVRGDAPRAGTSTDLAVGQELQVDFFEFVGTPFGALTIEIEDESPEFEGSLFDVSGLPAEFIVHLDASDPAIVSGRVDLTTTDVRVLLDGSERLFLDLSHEPLISTTDLGTDLKVRVRGIISGLSSAPDIAADDLRVKPGRLHGTVLSVDTSTSSFIVDVSKIDDPFGGAALPDPVTLTFATDAQVEGDADTVQEFFDLFAALASGETLEVEVFGIADGSGGATAHEIDASVED